MILIALMVVIAIGTWYLITGSEEAKKVFIVSMLLYSVIGAIIFL